MALVKGETRGGLNNPQPPVKTKPVVPPKSPGAIKTAVEPAAPNFADEKPVPALQAHGFQGGISEFNFRVQAAHDSYQAKYGVQPSPGLIFDLAKSPVQTTDFPKMFTVPLSQQQAKARAANITHGDGVPTEPIMSAQHLADGIVNAAKQGNYHDFITANADLIHGFSQNKKDAAVIASANFNARRLTAFRDVETKVNNGDLSPFEGHAQLQEMGLIPGGSSFHELKGVGGELALGVGQVADALTHSPAGLYQLGKAVGLDANDALNHGANHGDLLFPRSRKAAKATVAGVKRDVSDPGANPGYLFMDVLGVASAGAGTAARLSAAGEALRAGEGVGAAARAAAAKPELTRAAIRFQNHTEQLPLIQSPLIAAAQRLGLKIREASAERGPTGLSGILHETSIGEALDKNASFARKIGRQADARKRTDHITNTQLQRQLDKAAGSTARQATVVSRVSDRFRRGLSRGENKAIQALSWDDPDPIPSEKAFHERLIEAGVGDKKAHQRQIADLALAEKALKDPSPRFKKALALTVKVEQEMTRLKVEELGLLPETAEGRIAKVGQQLRDPLTVAKINAATDALARLQGIARSQVAKAGEADPKLLSQIAKYKATLDNTPNPLVGGERVEPMSFYSPIERVGKQKRQPSDNKGYFPTKPGPYGIPLGRDLPELKHSYSGKALEIGDYRIDTPHLTSEAYGRTVRAVEVRSEHAKLWDESSPTKRSKWDVPIRDVNTIPDELRTAIAKIDEGYVTNEDVEALPPNLRDLITHLYPDEASLGEEEIPHVRWVDSRVLGDASSMPGHASDIAKVGDLVNAPFRFTTLYARPAYILNKLGNEAMLVFDQGIISAARNMVKAMNVENRYGVDNAELMRAHVGAGHSLSLVNGNVTRAGQAIAEWWNKVADRDERVASFIHYAERKGYKTKEDMTRLLTHPDARADLHEVSARANKALVQFDNLTEFEKNVIRHYVFVYPWVSRSAVWSIRAIMEHPLRASILTQIGQQDIENDPLTGKVVEWVRRSGYVPLGFNHDGSVKVVNPSSINTFSTIGNYLQLAKGFTQGDKYATAEDYMGPFPRFLIHAISGRDQYGNQYKGSQIVGAAKEVLVGLPQVVAYQKSQKAAAQAAKSPNIASRDSLVASYKAALRKTVLTPGWLDGMGALLAGGLSPRSLNLDAATARYWNDQNPDVRQQRQLTLLNHALDAQGEVLQRKVPPGVKAAVKDLASISYEASKFQKAHGRAPTEAERTKLTIDFLHGRKQLTSVQASKLTAELHSADPDTIPTMRNLIFDKYGYGKQLRQWDTDIRTVASFKKETFNFKAATLFSQGLADQKAYNVSQDKLYDYGRKYVDFVHQVQALHKSGATPDQLRAFEDAHDKSVDGLPSFVRVAWANRTPADQQAAIASATVASWKTLSAFDKALLGRPTDARVTAGYVKLGEIVDEQRKALAREGRAFPSGYERTLAQYVQKYYNAPGLVKDYDFARQPLFQRMKYLAPIQKSPNKDLWTEVLGQAGQIHKYLGQKDDQGRHTYNTKQVRQMWNDYVGSQQFQAWLAERPSFKAEVASYGKTTLASLVN